MGIPTACARREEALGEIKQPTAISHPREDDQSDLSNAVMLQTKLGGLVEVAVLDDCYHMVTLDKQRSVVVDRAIDFAQRLTQRLEKPRSCGAAGQGVRRVKPAISQQSKQIKTGAERLPVFLRRISRSCFYCATTANC